MILFQMPFTGAYTVMYMHLSLEQMHNTYVQSVTQVNSIVVLPGKCDHVS